MAMSDRLQELQQNPRVQASVKKALQWLGEEENSTVEAVSYGGQGIIFRVESKKYPYPLSIKVPLFDGEKKEAEYQQLIKTDWERMHLGAEKDHTLFPELICCDEQGDFLIRQYLEGTVLNRAIKTASEQERLDMFLRVTVLTEKVFRAFHESKEGCYIIKDYRAKNIMVENGTGNLYLFDCGSAAKEPKDVSPKYTKKPFELGTGDCLTWAPERLMGYKDLIDRRLDFFSYGVLAYHVLYGKLPYTNEEKEELAAWEKYYREYYGAVRNIRQDERLQSVPVNLVEQMIGCLHPDPHKRFCGKLVLS